MTPHEHAARLWREHFSGVPMPAPRPTPYGGLYVGDGRHVVRITAPPRSPSPRMQHAYSARYQVSVIDGAAERVVSEGRL